MAIIALLAITGLVTETNRLTTTAVEGKLSVRGDVSRFRGDFAKIVQGINNTLEAVITPFWVSFSERKSSSYSDYRSFFIFCRPVSASES